MQGSEYQPSLILRMCIILSSLHCQSSLRPLSIMDSWLCLGLYLQGHDSWCIHHALAEIELPSVFSSEVRQN